ncbi:MAG: YfhO family protein [Bacteroidota bacterium]
MKIQFKSDILPHLVAVVLFLAISFAYFSPVFDGKEIKQSDVMNYYGMSKEITDFRDQTGEEALWTNSMFGGMPAYLISVRYNSNLLSHLHALLNLFHTRPVNYLFVLLLGFYIALLLFRVNPWLSIAGAIAFGLSSYFLIVIEAGHLTKVQALGYMPPVIAGVYYAYNRKIILGALIAGLFLALQLLVNHLQITYYTLLVILVLIVFQLIQDIRQKSLMKFIKASVVLGAAVILAVGVNFGSIYLTYDYGKDSMRGKSELTHDIDNKTGGLDKDYATAWSYGKGETFNLLVPNLMGGASGGALSEDSDTYKYFESRAGKAQARQIIKQLPLYWGPQPFTSGPVYIGAIVVFLFVLGMFIVKGPVRWWLFTATLLAILLAWGKNLNWLTDLFLDYFPGYNKFRTVSMILVIAEFTMPLLGIFAIQRILNGEVDKQKLKKGIFWSLGIVGGLCLLFAAIPGAFFSFDGLNDAAYESSGYPMDAIRADRQSLLQADAFRSLVFVILGAAVIFGVYIGKLKKGWVYFCLAALFIFDLWTIDRRYLNNDDFVPKREMKTPFTPTMADQYILQDPDPDFRVLNVAVNTFNDASTSYFHKSIGGYHGAKMKRYQELIDFHISKNNMAVLNMLNTKYFIIPTEEKGPVPQQNPEALGNAWFVEQYRLVENADEEINALTDFDPAKEAIVDKRFASQLEGLNLQKDSTAAIHLLEYKPNHLSYESQTGSDQLAVFSEIYYSKGWNAYIDGQPAPHIRANYVLRAMKVPAGKHSIEFKFEPKMYYTGNTISLISSVLLILFIIGVIVYELKAAGKKQEETAAGKK